ncbi:MAG: addiction module toxin RelE [Candidatus Nitrohelix vancouverensis]|uniref:Addiction module toxin RelE n=1 Tax=Candidatus Nitrohelix vancouverensis TaxID=2705534 RepID=A0A7T0G2S2_9BACT|nr:MAG: addiction module toxin RelE [Candidatus Nitrohelix vancouverensis]
MEWKVEFHDLFEPEFDALTEDVQDEILALGKLLRRFGPHLERPHVGSLKESKHANLKELRFNADDGVWRVAFAFDPKRKAILLVAGDKSGKSKTAFYKRLIKKADKRFDAHLEELKAKRK